MRLAVPVEEGQRLPGWGYGLAYFDFARGVMVYWPIPFNYVVRLLREVEFWWAKIRSRRSRFDRMLIQVRQLGYERGLVEGRKEMQAKLNRALWEWLVEEFGEERARRMVEGLDEA